MPVYPVIMCGGAGTRLWPSSRPGRPKQFLPLIGARSLLQETALRVRDLATAGGRLLIVAGAAHGQLIRAQMDEIGVEAAVIAEPEPRDSAAAVAVAAVWIAERHPDGVAVIVASDHHIPDAAAFRAAVEATAGAARAGAIVTLGVQPTAPATAYGYIRPGAADVAVRPVAAFVEKPDAERAAAYVAEGYLWNSGNFVAGVATLLEELGAQAPATVQAAQAGLAAAVTTDGVALLGAPFLAAPKISFDYAVMEGTRRAAVLPVSFQWSDLGAWDAVLAASPKDERGNSLPPGGLVLEGRDVLVRAPEGLRVSVIGASRLAVIVERDAVLVCDLDHAQSVKAVSDAVAPGGPEGWALPSLDAAAAWFTSWLETAALPVWGTLGVEAGTGRFREGLTPAGQAHDPYLRIRTQTRQVMVFATAAAEGRPGPWAALALSGLEHLRQAARRKDGLFVTSLSPQGAVVDETARLYEQAFALMALAAAHAIGAGPTAAAEARALRDGLAAFRHPAGGFKEVGPHPFQANAQMHLFEACMMWEALDGEGNWGALADGIAELALRAFIDTDTGRLEEFFAADWTPLAGEAGLVEPGHHFEWAWLLQRWGVARARPAARSAARRLFDRGLAGVDLRRGVALNAVWADFIPRDASARLWPQTEYLKAALIFGEVRHALTAANTLRRFLDTPVRGLWRDRMRADGGFNEEPAPATSFYHLYLAIQELERVAAGA